MPAEARSDARRMINGDLQRSRQWRSERAQPTLLQREHSRRDAGKRSRVGGGGEHCHASCGQP
jgi:hypothetical protein